MTQEQKDDYFEKAKEILSRKQAKIQEAKEQLPREMVQLKALSQSSIADELTYQTLMAQCRRRYDDLGQLLPSPYFYSCQMKFDNEEKPRELFFAKFAFDEEDIYSWASPAAKVRFEKPGRFAYEGVENRIQKGELFKKEQYLINDGRILFLAKEELGQPRQLIYQEYFSTRKTAFILPEIVAQMEKAQDEVIRADWRGPLLISGPAGSGKTTLALHRIAYLLQSPETAGIFQGEKILVLVQDKNTKDYFSHLLPEFGIKEVEITTLEDLARKILPLDGWQVNNRLLPNEQSLDDYIIKKIQALRSIATDYLFNKRSISFLDDIYKNIFTADEEKVWCQQKKDKVIDRIDLAGLLLAQALGGRLEVEKDYYQMARDGSLKKRKGRFLAQYQLIVLDEFQNYLPEEIKTLKLALALQDGSLLYVGDLNQQIRLGTIRDFTEVDEVLPSDRRVVLQKVYRNTKEILGYLRGLGYQTIIPDQLKSGPAVEELALTEQEEIKFIKAAVCGQDEISIGILAERDDYVKRYQQELGTIKNIRIMSMAEAQGVEFDTVFLVGLDRPNFMAYANPVLAGEKARIRRDLLYIALTRAMNKLYVLGRVKLSEILQTQ
ncbi:MAG: UvrD-helicase domain-containing protein [Patescibacteria group bacterium]